MNTKRTLVSFLLIASVLLLTSMVSAHTLTGVEINGEDVTVVAGAVTGTYDETITAGDELTVKVKFTADVDESESVKIKATLEGEEDEVTATASTFVEDGKNYSKTLTLKVPADFDEESVSGDYTLTLEIGDDEIELADFINVQRTSYETAITGDAENTVEAGESLQIEFEVENTGYNTIEDAYAIVSIAELDISKKVSLGDLLNVESYADVEDDDDEDDYTSIKETLNLEIPSDAKAGVYTLKITVSNDDEDLTNTATKEVTIENSVSELVLKSGNDLILLNPTNQLKVYTVKYDTTEAVVVMPAASSKTVTIESQTNEAFDVVVMSGETILGTVNFEGSSESAQVTSPVFVLTVVLAIVFLVLLVVLVVLITKKPQKTEEFGESYY